MKNFDAQGDFDFPAEVEKLGQKEGKNYFAIVHVDGNNMGLKFRKCTGLTERRKLSREIRRKTEGAYRLCKNATAFKFLQQLGYQQQHLPEVADWDNFQEKLWHAGATPYVDAIELIDFYDEETARTWQKLTRR